MPETYSRETVVALGEIRNPLLRLILDFIYVGEVQVPSPDLEEFMKSADILGIRGLKTDENSAKPAAPNLLRNVRTSAVRQDPLASDSSNVEIKEESEDSEHAEERVVNQSRKRSVAGTPALSLPKKPMVAETDKMKHLIPSGISIEASTRRLSQKPVISLAAPIPSTSSAQFEVNLSN
jgi:hypothetical protein